MHKQARFPEIFDQILQSPSPILPRTPLPPKLESLIFIPEPKSDLTQNTHPPPKIENSNFLSGVQIWSYPPPPSGGWSMWGLMVVSPKDTISFQ